MRRSMGTVGVATGLPLYLPHQLRSWPRRFSHGSEEPLANARGDVARMAGLMWIGYALIGLTRSRWGTRMRYWVTTHWPRREGWTDEASAAVWLPDGREAAGAQLAVDDRVVVYESRSGRVQLVHRPDGTSYTVRCRTGREGVVYYGRVSEPLHADAQAEPEEYVDGSQIWWRWTARLEVLSRSGFLARQSLLSVLGYDSTWNMRGFGTLHSGLKEITEEQYRQIVSGFHEARPIQLPELPVPRGHGGVGGVGEGETHERLKLHVAGNPEAAIGELGLQTLKVEYPFPSGDRADIVMADAYGRIVGVEVEPSVEDGDVVGVLQAIKYRYMLELMADREPGDSRAILVAHRISQGTRELCARYGVEYVEVPRAIVGG